MTNDIMNRVRKVDINKLNAEQIQQLEEQLGSKLREIVDEACNKANSVLNIYGLETKMQIVVQEKEQQ